MDATVFSDENGSNSNANFDFKKQFEVLRESEKPTPLVQPKSNMSIAKGHARDVTSRKSVRLLGNDVLDTSQ